MRALMIFGVLLVIFGTLALGFQTVTFFTHERLVDAGLFKVDVARPHTIVFHPIVGILAVVSGLVMIVAGRRTSP